MKVERFFYGMVKGKIVLLKTDGLNQILSDESFQFLRKLVPTDNNQWWLPTEQIVAVSHVEEIDDDNGRTWVQNQTLLIPILNYIQLTKPYTILHEFFEPIMQEAPTTFNPVEIKVNP